MDTEKINEELRPFVLRLLTQGYHLEDLASKEVFKFKKDEKDYYVFIHTGQNQEETFKIFDLMLEKGSIFYLLSKDEKDLYSIVKIRLFKWVNTRLGGMTNAKNIDLTVNFGNIEQIPLKWEKLKF